MPTTRRAMIAGSSVVALLTLLSALALAASPARATIVLLSTSSGPPSPQDANLYDWRGQWTSALDRAAPVPGQRPVWQVNLGLYGDIYTPPGTNVIELNPTCAITLQIDGAPLVQTNLNPCVEGPFGEDFGGRVPSPVSELLTPNLAAAGNGPHTVTVTGYESLGGAYSATSFNVLVDNILPSPSSLVGAVGWQRGGEVVGATASTTGPSGIAGQDCAVGSSLSSWYPGASAQIAVTGDGQIPVRCTARNNAGVKGPSTQFNAMLDNTPPTGYFAPRDPNNPTAAAVNLADSESGVAGGQIQIQTASGWQALATSYDPATGQLNAAIPDNGRLTDGNYALRAVVSDAVGNTAVVTADQNGTPEVVTEPLRIVTQVRVGRSHALVRRCTVTRVRVRRDLKLRHQWAAARLVRRCSEQPVPRDKGIVDLRFAQHATVAGLVQTADGQPLAGAPVQVATQATGWRTHPVATVTTNSAGRFSYTITSGPSRTITFLFPGSSTLRASAGATTVGVIGEAKIKAGPHARAGGHLWITGRVLGGYIPTGGVLVQLQYRVVGLSVGWAPFHAPIATDRYGLWSATFPVPPGASGYAYAFRALITRQSDWPFRATHSNAIVRAVT